MSDTQELLEIKKQLEKFKEQTARLKGKAEEIERRFREEFGYKTPKHANRDKYKLQQELETLQTEFSTKMHEIKEKYSAIVK